MVSYGMIKPYFDDGKGHVIYNADCLEVLPTLAPVDLICTDPPYGINADKTQKNRAGRQDGQSKAPSRDYGESAWDKDAISMDLLNDVIGAGRWAAIWGGNYYAVKPSSCWLIWDKENGDNGYADAEMCWTNFPKAVRLKRHMWNGMLRKNNEERMHPTQKPLDVMKWAILLAPAYQTILDPFMGSGTTLRAAKDLGLPCIGIELEEKYAEIAARRLEQEVFDFGDLK